MAEILDSSQDHIFEPEPPTLSLVTGGDFVGATITTIHPQVISLGEVLERRTSLPFHVAKVAAGGFVFYPALYHGAGMFRAHVYIDKKQYLPESARQADGTERDDDDGRSYHYVVSQRPTSDTPEVIGTGRLIVKGNQDDLLPVEHFFSDKIDDPAPVGSLECSRLIAQSADKVLQSIVKLAVIRAMAFESLEVEAPYVYATLEPSLFIMLKMIGLPFRELTNQPQWVEQYKSQNLAVRLDPKEILPSLREKDKSRPPEKAVAPFFDKELENKSFGLGHFTRNF